tara:strand:- start:260 stop:2176 length:1917 start_codon:yes stop_codon:yes gene_type:complete
MKKNTYLKPIKFTAILFYMINITVSYSQTLKSFYGPYNSGKNQKGTATYKYYEDTKTREYLKQGAFNFKFIGKENYQGLTQNIFGNFNKGLKNGTWTHKITMKDYKLGNYYHTGSISLVSHYKNGEADGSWIEVYKDKARKKLYSFGKYYWTEYTSQGDFSISMNFKKGLIVGAVDIKDVMFRAKGSYDQNSYSIGTWNINLIDKNQSLEIVYKDKYMVDFNGRNSAGEILDGSTSTYAKENAQDFQRYLSVKAMSQEEKENSGFILEKYQGEKNLVTKYINDYFKYMMSSDWFLYKQIKGDLTYEIYAQNYTIPGGLNMVVQKVNYGKMEDVHQYKKAEEAFKSGSYIDALKKYNAWREEITKFGYRNKSYKTAALKNLDQKILISLEKADSLSRIYMTMDLAYKYKEAIGNIGNRNSKNINMVNEKISEEISEITAAFEIQNNDYYRPYKIGVWKGIDNYMIFWKDKINNCIKQEQKYDRDFILTGKYGETISYCPCVEDSLINILTIKEEGCLESFRNALFLSQQFESKVKQIEEFNLEKSTRLLYSTYSNFLESFKLLYSGRYMSRETLLEENMQILTKVNLSLDKIIILYTNKATKSMDKGLKKAYYLKEKNELLFPLFVFDNDGKFREIKFK